MTDNKMALDAQHSEGEAGSTDCPDLCIHIQPVTSQPKKNWVLLEVPDKSNKSGRLPSGDVFINKRDAKKIMAIIDKHWCATAEEWGRLLKC